MKGKYRILVQNKKIKYEFELKRNITVIRGDSATGKTALVDMIREYYENGVDSGVDLLCEKTCVVLEGRNWQPQLAMFSDSIVFIDEGNAFVTSQEFASAIQQSDNYYVIVTRESLANLPYAVSEIYGIRNSGKYGQLKQIYNEFFHIYGEEYLQEPIRPELLIIEDSRSGYQFFKAVCEKRNLKCISAEGKSNIFGMLKNHKEESLLVIADGAAFGPEMEKIMRQKQLQENIALYLPESFEWIILKSDVIKDAEVKEILEEPEQFIESREFFSWERYFTRLLVNKTAGTHLKYSKATLNITYLQENEEKKILDVVETVDFDWK